MNQNKENYKFQKLTPVDNVELGVYEEALDFVFNNDDIKNVAISGAYSAGKSSVLETYKGLRDNLRFLHVSLAYFDQCDKNKNEPHVLEGKILNQLIHQIPSESIPQTNFRIKQEIKKSTIKKHICLIGLLIFFGLYFLCFNSWKSYVLDLPEGCLKSIMHIFFNGYTPIFILFFSGGLLCHLFYKLVVLQRNKNIFKRLKIHGNEIEIFEENRDSYFDKYLNEVLYLFENSETDVIVFEDLDRFNAIKIFERLREINILINKKVKNKPLRFFYLVRDDIFVSKDRTKFFDYIVPIVPVIDGSNSYEKFIAYFEANDMIEKFDSGFLQYKGENLLSLAGVYQPKKEIGKSKIPVALSLFLEKHPGVDTIYLHLDNDKTGRLCTKALTYLLEKKVKVVDMKVPIGKDVNDFLMHYLGKRKKPKEKMQSREHSR